MKRRNILPRTKRSLARINSIGFGTYVLFLLILLGSSSFPVLFRGTKNEGSDGCTTTNMVLTLTTVPDIKNVTTVCNLKNEVVLIATSSQYNNSNIKNSSEGSWHVVETWRVILSTIVVFPSAELLQLLHDIFDNVDDGKGNPDSESAKLRNIDTVHKIVSRISRRINRICKLLKRKLVSKHAAKLVPMEL